jgi:putative chitinase
MVTPAQLKEILPLCRDSAMWCRALALAFAEFGIDGPAEEAEFIAQTGHESMQYNRLTENLNYSARGLMSTWPKRFTSLEFANTYARVPEKIANRVYADRLGNGDEKSGDGYRYRGRGLIQITGKDNYKRCGDALKLNLVVFPHKLEDPVQAARSAAWYWRERNLDAVTGDIEADTKKINGGLNGLEDREAIYERAKRVLRAV